MSGDAIGDVVCGVVAGTVGKCIDYPLDTVKTKLQAPGATYAGSWDCFVTIARREGLRGFYAGIAAPIAGAAAEKAVVFAAYGAGKRVYEAATGDYPAAALQPGERDSLRKCVFAGGFSGIATALILTPFELVKCKVQVEPTRWRGVVHCAADTLRTHGPLALTHGFVPCIWREVFGNLFWFGLYEAVVRAHPSSSDPQTARPGWLYPVAGGVGGVAFWTMSFPFDTIKTQAQVSDEARRLGLVGGGRRIVREAGVAGLFRGWNVTALRAFPASGGIFATFELVAQQWRSAFHAPARAPEVHAAAP